MRGRRLHPAVVHVVSLVEPYAGASGPSTPSTWSAATAGAFTSHKVIICGSLQVLSNFGKASAVAFGGRPERVRSPRSFLALRHLFERWRGRTARGRARQRRHRWQPARCDVVASQEPPEVPWRDRLGPRQHEQPPPQREVVVPRPWVGEAVERRNERRPGEHAIDAVCRRPGAVGTGRDLLHLPEELVQQGAESDWGPKPKGTGADAVDRSPALARIHPGPLEGEVGQDLPEQPDPRERVP